MKASPLRLAALAFLLAGAVEVSRPSTTADAAPPLAPAAAPVGSCSLVSATVNFGSLADPSTGDTDGAGTVTFYCANGLPVSLDVGNGNQPDASARPARRRLYSSANNAYLQYNLFADANRTSVWGSGLGGRTVHVIGTGTNQTVPIYARIFRQTAPGIGVYTDALVVTISF